MSSNALFQTLTVVALAAHLGVLGALGWSSRGLQLLALLNALVATAVLLYALTRAKYILASMDWPYLGLIALELVVLTGAIWVFKDSRLAAVWSYVAFGLHGCASLVAVIFAFTFKMTRLM